MTDLSVLVDHLFRHEWGKLVSTLVRVLGVRHVEIAEDVVQDALCRALEVWKYRGVPENPTAWLFQTARHRAVDLLRRHRRFDEARPKLSRTLAAGAAEDRVVDNQLRMMLSCARPGIPAEGQVAVILKYLCGFSVPEIARSFLASPAAVEKRLARAVRSMKREEGAELPDPEATAGRLGPVHQALYLLFNEGYHGSHPERSVREELCAEAIRLGNLLASHPAAATPATFALLALLCLHAARLPSRVDDSGSLILLEAQDRSLWSRPLVEQGITHLGRSAAGDELTSFHLEAGIAAVHAQASSFAETDWSAIFDLYTKLYRLSPTPVVALNRAIALGRVRGPDEGLRMLEGIRVSRTQEHYPFFEAAAGDFHERAGRGREAKLHFRKARDLARNDAERRILDERLSR